MCNDFISLSIVLQLLYKTYSLMYNIIKIISIELQFIHNIIKEIFNILQLI